MNGHASYLLLLAGCLLITLPLEFGFGARVWRRPGRMLRALAVVLVIFVPVDLLGIARDWWSYSARFISGVHLGPMPLEELLFFVVVPICGLLTYEAVGICLAQARRWRRG